LEARILALGLRQKLSAPPSGSHPFTLAIPRHYNIRMSGDLPSTTTFTFLGTAHPERRGWWFDRFEVRESSGIVFSAEMRGSRFVASITLPSGTTPDLLTARNHASMHLRTVTDAIGMLNGVAISGDITEALDPTGALHALDPHLRELAVEYTASDLRRLMAAGFNDQAVRLGMADVRMALLNAVDTAFLCYRAIEGVKQVYGDWETLRMNLSIPYDRIMELKSLADPRRHGGAAQLTHDQRVEALTLAHRTVLDYAGVVWSRLPPEVRAHDTATRG
jgi:hypothetical protein